MIRRAAIAVAEEDARGVAVQATLGALAPGETARVVRLSPECRGAQRRRLLDLGLVPGTPVTAELVSLAGDPVAYRIRGALIALRREQANRVVVWRGEGAEEAG
jgi:DtxR family Mn-dependent transcriptional regulator